MSKLAPITVADKWMQQGVAEAARMRNTWQQTKLSALNAGLYFFNARSAVNDGDFAEFLGSYEEKISRSTVYRWIQFYEEAIAWAADEKPSLKGKPALLLEHARKMVMQSPKPFVALMRQLGEMRKFGEYDAVKYAAQKRIGNAQIEFEFDYEKTVASLDALAHIDEPNFRFKIPDGKTSDEALAELETRLEDILAKIKSQRADAQTLEA